MDGKLWLFYAALAGLCWGTYVPLVQQGIRGLGQSHILRVVVDADRVVPATRVQARRGNDEAALASGVQAIAEATC